MAIGAYAAAILTMPLAQKKVNLPDLPPFLAVTEINFLTATIIAGLIAAIIALFVGISLMRLNGPYVSVATMGFLVIVQVVLINWDSLTLGARTFSGVPDYSNLYWVWTWVIVAVYVVWRIGKSSFGRAMIATRENEIAAQSLGINVMRSRLIAFCVSAFFTAVAGSLWAHFIMSFSPKSFYFSQAFNIITMMVVGGAGSVSGSVIGATTITILSEILRNAERGVDLGFIKIPRSTVPVRYYVSNVYSCNYLPPWRNYGWKRNSVQPSLDWPKKSFFREFAKGGWRSKLIELSPWDFCQDFKPKE